MDAAANMLRGLFLVILSTLLAPLLNPALAADTTKKSQAVRSTGSPPLWPGAYEIQYELSLPYVESVQSGGLK